jgi:hypothetical protein
VIKFTKEQQKSVIWFLYSEGVKTSKTYGRVAGNCISQKKVYEWVEKFKGGWKIVINCGQTDGSAYFGQPKNYSSRHQIACFKVTEGLHPLTARL